LKTAVRFALEDLEKLMVSPYSTAEDADEVDRVRPILSDILHLLEIA